MANEQKPQTLGQRLGAAAGAASVFLSAAFGGAGVANAANSPSAPTPAPASAPVAATPPTPPAQVRPWTADQTAAAAAGQAALLGDDANLAAEAARNTIHLTVGPQFLGGSFALPPVKVALPDFAAEAQAARTAQAAKAVAHARRANAKLAAEVKADEGTIAQQGKDLAAAQATADQAAKDNANLNARVSGDEQKAAANQRQAAQQQAQDQKQIEALKKQSLWELIGAAFASLLAAGGIVYTAISNRFNKNAHKKMAGDIARAHQEAANAAALAARAAAAGPAAANPGASVAQNAGPAAPVPPPVAPAAAAAPARIVPELRDKGIEYEFARPKFDSQLGPVIQVAVDPDSIKNEEWGPIVPNPSAEEQAFGQAWAGVARAQLKKDHAEAIARAQQEAAAAAAPAAAIPGESSVLRNGDPADPRTRDNPGRRKKLLGLVVGIGAKDRVAYSHVTDKKTGVSKVYVAQAGKPDIHAFTVTDKTITTYPVPGDSRLSKTLEAHSIQIAAAKWNGNFTVTDPATGQVDPRIEMNAAKLTALLIDNGKLTDIDGKPLTAKDVVINGKPLTEILNPSVAATAGFSLAAGAAPAGAPPATANNARQPSRVRLSGLGR